MEHNIVVVDEADGSLVGAIVWWRLSGGLDIDNFSTFWSNTTLHKGWLPTPVGFERAFRRACVSQQGGRRLVRPLESHKGFAIVDELARGSDLSHRQRVNLTLDNLGRIVAQASDDSVLDEDTEALVKTIQESYIWHQDNLTQSDVSAWLCKIMDRIQAVSLRDTGGVYFVPADALAKWELIVGCLRAASAHTVLSVPAMRTEQAVEAALDAIANESLVAIQALEKTLEEHNSPESDTKLGARALAGRVAAAEKVAKKIAQYESLLGASLPSLTERLTELSANLVMAQMAAEV